MDDEHDEQLAPATRPVWVKVVAWSVIAVLVAGGAASYGGFVLGRTTDLSVGTRHSVTVHPQSGCANPAPVTIGHVVFDSRSASPPTWTGPVHGTLTITLVEADPPHLRHAVFVPDSGDGQVSFAGGVGRFSTMPCAVSG